MQGWAARIIVTDENVTWFVGAVPLRAVVAAEEAAAVAAVDFFDCEAELFVELEGVAAVGAGFFPPSRGVTP